VYEDLRDDTDRFAQLAGYIGRVPVTLDAEDRGERFRVWSQLATPNYFDVLGIQPATGRLFGPAERVEGTVSVVLGDRLWRTTSGPDRRLSVSRYASTGST